MRTKAYLPSTRPNSSSRRRPVSYLLKLFNPIIADRHEDNVGTLRRALECWEELLERLAEFLMLLSVLKELWLANGVGKALHAHGALH